MKKVTLILFIILVGAAAAMGQGETKGPGAKPAEGLPSVDQIIDKYVQALGGKAAIQGVTSRSMKGTFEVPAFGASGTIERYSKAPNKMVIIVEIGGFGTVQQGFNGTAGWSQDPQTGMRDIAGPELAQTKREADIYRDIKLKDLYPKMVVAGKDKVADRDVYVIEATPADGGPEKMYFDAQNGLLVRTDLTAHNASEEIATQTFLEDYKDVDGVKVPTTIRQTNPNLSFTMKFSEIKSNVPVDETKFNKPASQ
jgi:zinc protease